MEERFYYKGAIHIHSSLSDGTGDINSISKAAKKAGLDFIVITDHNYIDTDEGIINGVYVIKGQEISPRSCNHYLAFGVKDVINIDENPQVYADKVRELGGFGFAAHPDEGVTTDKKGNYLPRKNSNHCIPWLDKNVKPDGIEIWNWFSNWADNLNDKNIFTLAYAFLFKHKIVTNPSKLTLEWWDKLNSESENIVPALGGVDAHALKINQYIIPVTVFPYKTCFETITNIINMKEPLSKDFQKAKEQILSAIKQGNNLIINRKFSKDIPVFYISDNKTFAFCGENIDLISDAFLNIKLNKKTDIKIILDGKEIKTLKSNSCTIPVIKKGKYRIEFSYGKKGFAYSNPILVK